MFEKVYPEQQSVSILDVISRPHLPMDSYHLSSDVFQNKTIIVGFSKI